MIGLIDTLYTPLKTTGNTALLYLTVAHTLRFSVFTNRLLATDL
jgi:hypothetical protein